MRYFFTSESVSEGHPDKVADQISDAILDEHLRRDPSSKVACEVLVTKGRVVIAGEVRCENPLNKEEVESIVRGVIKRIGYDRPELDFDHESCIIDYYLHEQSDDIYQGVDRHNKVDQGAGDQGMMFGYACTEMDNYMPLVVEIAHMLVQELARIRREGKLMTYLRPDSKSQVTLEYEDGQPVKVDNIVVSTQHDEFILPDNPYDEASKKRAQDAMKQRIEDDIKKHLFPRVKKDLPGKYRHFMDVENIRDIKVNPTGNFVQGGPASDTGLTGRKIIVDTYGGACPHGGGAFSGKDSSKVDRSAAYATRHIAKNIVAAGIASRVLVQVAYAIGHNEPVSVFVDTYNTCSIRKPDGSIWSDAEIAEKIKTIFDLRPGMIVDNLELTNPIFGQTSAYGHFGRSIDPANVEVYYEEIPGGRVRTISSPRLKKVEYFTWERTDYVDKLKEAFSL